MNVYVIQSKYTANLRFHFKNLLHQIFQMQNLFKGMKSVHDMQIKFIKGFGN